MPEPRRWLRHRFIKWGVRWGKHREGILRLVPWKWRRNYCWRYRNVGDAWYFRAWALELRVMKPQPEEG